MQLHGLYSQCSVGGYRPEPTSVCEQLLDAQAQPARRRLNIYEARACVWVGRLRIFPGRRKNRSGVFFFGPLNSLARLWAVLLVGYARTSQLTGLQSKENVQPIYGGLRFSFDLHFRRWIAQRPHQTRFAISRFFLPRANTFTFPWGVALFSASRFLLLTLPAITSHNQPCNS